MRRSWSLEWIEGKVFTWKNVASLKSGSLIFHAGWLSLTSSRSLSCFQEILEWHSHHIFPTISQHKNARLLHVLLFASKTMPIFLISADYEGANVFSYFSKAKFIYFILLQPQPINPNTQIPRPLFPQIKVIIKSNRYYNLTAQMLENEKTPSLDRKKQIQWQHYNYPPLLNIMHFVPSQVPHDRKFIVMSLFALHLASVGVCLLNFIDNCIQGGIGILYSLLFTFIFIPVLLYLFYRGLTGICKKQGNLKIYLIVQPIAIVLEIVAAIGNFLGFNGFVRVSEMFGTGQGAAAVFGLIVSLVFLAMAVFSGFIYFRVVKERSTLKESLM